MGHRRTQSAWLEGPLRLDVKARAVLLVLLDTPLHGYEIAKRINRRMGFWIPPKHIYAPLKQLERAGLVWSRKEAISEPPGFRRVYYPTEAAKDVREDWFSSPPTTRVLRADIHARVAFSKEEDAPELLRALAEYRAHLLDAIEENKMTWSAPEGSYDGLVLRSLRAEVDKQTQSEIEWANELSDDLKEIIGRRRSL
jgi:DNA-binding PadR family transcriptional regulator